MIDIVELNSILRTFLFLEIIHMPKKSSSNGARIKVTEDDVLLEGGEEQDDSAGQDDLDSVGVDNGATNGESNGSSRLQALHSSLTGSMKRVFIVNEDERILQQLRDKRLSLEKALKLLTYLEHAATLTDRQMDAMAKIAGFPVNSKALTAYIKEIGGGSLSREEQQLILHVDSRNEMRDLLPLDLDSRDHEVFADTITEPN